MSEAIALPEAPSDTILAACSRYGITYPQYQAEVASSLLFRFPMPRPLTNASGRSRHWRTMEREKKAYWTTCNGLYHARLLPPLPDDAPWEKARILSTMILGGAMDDDNAMARHKWAIDWLAGWGYVKSDRKTCLVWGDFPIQTVTRKEEAKIILTLMRRA